MVLRRVGPSVVTAVYALTGGRQAGSWPMHLRPGGMLQLSVRRCASRLQTPSSTCTCLWVREPSEAGKKESSINRRSVVHQKLQYAFNPCCQANLNKCNSKESNKGHMQLICNNLFDFLKRLPLTVVTLSHIYKGFDCFKALVAVRRCLLVLQFAISCQTSRHPERKIAHLLQARDVCTLQVSPERTTVLICATNSGLHLS